MDQLIKQTLRLPPKKLLSSRVMNIIGIRDKTKYIYINIKYDYSFNVIIN